MTPPDELLYLVEELRQLRDRANVPPDTHYGGSWRTLTYVALGADDGPGLIHLLMRHQPATTTTNSPRIAPRYWCTSCQGFWDDCYAVAIARRVLQAS